LYHGDKVRLPIETNRLVYQMPLTLTFQSADRLPVSAEGILPSRLCGLTPSAVEKLPLRHGNRQTPLAELFKVTGKLDSGELGFAGELSTVDDIGKGLDGGTLHIEGNVGHSLGASMSAGRIDLNGSAGDFAGCGMRGGVLSIHGNAGDEAGGSLPGGQRGMTGGTLLISGSAGNSLGHTMRRGIIAVGGPCGDFVGVNMLAGSIFLYDTHGKSLGAEMRRGTIFLLAGHEPWLLPTFRHACRLAPPILPLLMREIARFGWLRDAMAPHALFDLYHGDLLSLGRGEVLSRIC
jgi:formylmethanofuran dehydrogenase subunit C